MTVRGYLRASTNEQDADRARKPLTDFATERGLTIATFYKENESGAKLKRPELFRLLEESSPGDILLVEQVDRISRLNDADWKKLRTEIDTRQVRIVALDLPTSWTVASASDEFTGRMFEAINSMMLDMLAAVARKDYQDRRRRVAEGQAKAKAENRYRGRQEDTKRNEGIEEMLKAGMSYTRIQDATKASRATVAKIAKRMKDRASESA